MATFFMFGSYSAESINKISRERTGQASALIESNGGSVVSSYALLGKKDLVLIVDLPDTQAAIKTSVGLAKMLGVSFTSVPAISVEEFDNLTADL